jgi:hypothetical protein
MDPMAWEELDPAAAGLAEARLVLHHAAQPVAALGQSLAPPQPDDSQQSLSLAGPRSWLGARVAGGRFRAGLDPVALELRLCDGEGAPVASLPLAGRTMEEGLAFLGAELARRGAPPPALSLPRHPADFPRHPLGEGARFPAGADAARSQIARLFAGTDALLAELGRSQEAEVRLWPHHFDLACTLARGKGSVGMGISPGDGLAGLPYWYASPAPFPEGELPPLAGGGRWHLEGWRGGELPLASLSRGAAAQRAQVAAFLESVLAAAGG